MSSDFSVQGDPRDLVRRRGMGRDPLAGMDDIQAGQLVANPEQAYRYAVRMAGGDPNRTNRWTAKRARILQPLLNAGLQALEHTSGRGPADYDDMLRELATGMGQSGFYNKMAGLADTAVGKANLGGLDDEEQVMQFLAAMEGLRNVNTSSMVAQGRMDQFGRQVDEYNDVAFASPNAQNPMSFWDAYRRGVGANRGY